MLGKILAASLTLSIGGSGGVFAPSLFIGAMAGMAFGDRRPSRVRPGDRAAGDVRASSRWAACSAAAAQAPLTSIASVVEMTGNFTLTLPVMLASGIAAALSKRLTYGSIYTTKLLRRGIDIERPKAASCSRRSPSPTSCNRRTSSRARPDARAEQNGATGTRSRPPSASTSGRRR